MSSLDTNGQADPNALQMDKVAQTIAQALEAPDTVLAPQTPRADESQSAVAPAGNAGKQRRQSTSKGRRLAADLRALGLKNSVKTCFRAFFFTNVV